MHPVNWTFPESRFARRELIQAAAVRELGDRPKREDEMPVAREMALRYAFNLLRREETGVLTGRHQKKEKTRRQVSWGWGLLVTIKQNIV